MWSQWRHEILKPATGVVLLSLSEAKNAHSGEFLRVELYNGVIIGLMRMKKNVKRCFSGACKRRLEVSMFYSLQDRDVPIPTANVKPLQKQLQTFV